MPRPPRADEAGGLYHALNRGNLRADIFWKEADFAAFERILHEGLQIYQVDRAEDWRWGSLWRWQQKPEPYAKLLSPWPLPRLPKWVARVNDPLTKKELDAVRLSAQRGRPLGDDVWVESIASRLNLESTIRPRGRQKVRSQDDVPIKDA